VVWRVRRTGRGKTLIKTHPEDSVRAPKGRRALISLQQRAWKIRAPYPKGKKQRKKRQRQTKREGKERGTSGGNGLPRVRIGECWKKQKGSYLEEGDGLKNKTEIKKRGLERSQIKRLHLYLRKVLGDIEVSRVRMNAKRERRGRTEGRTASKRYLGRSDGESRRTFMQRGCFR